MDACEFWGLYFINRLFRVHAGYSSRDQRMWKCLWISYANARPDKGWAVVMIGDKKAATAVQGGLCRIYRNEKEISPGAEQVQQHGCKLEQLFLSIR